MRDGGGTVDRREGKRVMGQDPGRCDGRYVLSAWSSPMVYLSKASRPGPRTSLSLLGLKGPPDTTQANSSHSTLASSCLFPSTTEPDPAQCWQTHIPRRGTGGRLRLPRLKEEHVLTKHASPCPRQMWCVEGKKWAARFHLCDVDEPLLMKILWHIWLLEWWSVESEIIIKLRTWEKSVLHTSRKTFCHTCERSPRFSNRWPRSLIC